MSLIADPWRTALTVIAVGLLLLLGGLAVAVGHSSPAAAVPGIQGRAVPPVLGPQGDAISNDTGDLPQLD